MRSGLRFGERGQRFGRWARHVVILLRAPRDHLARRQAHVDVEAGLAVGILPRNMMAVSDRYPLCSSDERCLAPSSTSSTSDPAVKNLPKPNLHHGAARDAEDEAGGPGIPLNERAYFEMAFDDIGPRFHWMLRQYRQCLPLRTSRVLSL